MTEPQMDREAWKRAFCSRLPKKPLKIKTHPQKKGETGGGGKPEGREKQGLVVMSHVKGAKKLLCRRGGGGGGATLLGFAITTQLLWENIYAWGERFDLPPGHGSHGKRRFETWEKKAFFGSPDRLFRLLRQEGSGQRRRL